LLISSGFKRECQSFLKGKLKYMDEKKRLKSNYYLLVRNTHRIEKGLTMKPRRDVFAVKYIKNTVDFLEGLLKLKKNRDPQIEWVLSVLNKYFTSTGDNSTINKQRDRFNNLLKRFKIREESLKKSIPYLRYNNINSKITYEDFYTLTVQRRSIRWFEKKKVPRQKVDKAIKVAIQSPSACNRQPFKYYIIDNPELLTEIVKLPMGTSGYSHNIPLFIATVGDLSAYESDRDRHLIYIDASLANMSLMLALETLGLSSCPINWPDIEYREVKMAKLLNLKPYQRPVMCMGVGYADLNGLIAFSEKKSIDGIRSYNLS